MSPAPTSAPLALYIHLPWCVARCPYCDFNAHAIPDSWGGRLPVEEYLAALVRDMDADRERAGPRPTASVFFGGGTPSLFPPEAIGRILEAADARFPFTGDVEVTLEANPGTVDAARFRGFAEAGVGRLSLGVQSFDDGLLSRIGRIHDGGAARAATEHARAVFPRLNLDLMYGLPGQSLAQAEADVATALVIGADHLSHYQLTLEPGTVFAARPPALPDEDDCAAMLEAAAERLDRAGFQRYEISAYADSPAARCRHNLNYWRFGDYLGLGAGAHGKLTSPEGIHRSTRPSQPRRYLADGSANWHPVPDADLAFEYMLNALRLTEGFELADFETATGLSRDRIAAPLEEARRKAWLESEPGGGHLRPTEAGLAFHNDLQALFLPEDPPADAPARVGQAPGPDRLAPADTQVDH